LVNLLRNAIEAMEASPVRDLTLGTARWDSMVAVSVADTAAALRRRSRRSCSSPS